MKTFLQSVKLLPLYLGVLLVSGSFFFFIECRKAVIVQTKSSYPTTYQGTPKGERLRVLAQKRNFYIGTAAQARFEEPVYSPILSGEFNILTPENDFKMKQLRPAQNVFNFSVADEYVQFAKAHRMQIHGHTLIWHNSVPAWFANLPAGGVRDETKKHIQTVAEHFKGNILAWDVVNEALASDGNLRRNLWLEAFGPAYLDSCYIWAHRADPAAKLLYNEYNVYDNTSKKSNAMYALVRGMLARGIPIHGVGFQCHWKIEASSDISGRVEKLRQNIQRFSDLGLEIYLTEVDVGIKPEAKSSSDRPTDFLLQIQAETYGELLKMCLRIPAVKAFQMWGFADKHSWLHSSQRGYFNPCIFDIYYNPKPAYFALQTLLDQF